MAILNRYGYSQTAANPLRKIYIDETDDVNFSSTTIDFGVPAQFFWYEL
jgi:hypothetical protein